MGAHRPLYGRELLTGKQPVARGPGRGTKPPDRHGSTVPSVTPRLVTAGLPGSRRPGYAQQCWALALLPPAVIVAASRAAIGARLRDRRPGKRGTGART